MTAAESATDQLEELERRYRGQVLRLGAIALEMHQDGEIDEAELSRLASRVALTERRLREHGRAQA